MLLVDALFRFGGLALLGMIALSSWRYRSRWVSAPYLILACISLGALYLGYTRPEFAPPEPALAIVRFLDIPHLALIWLFALSASIPAFRLRLWHIAVCVLYSAPILWPRLGSYDVVPDQPFWLPVYGGVTSVILVGHLVWMVGKAIQRRGAARPSGEMMSFVMVLLVATCGAALAELIPDGASLPRQTAKIMAITPALLFGAAWMLRFKVPALAMAENPRAPEQLSRRDRELLDTIEDRLLRQQGYRDHDLTMARLAGEIGVSQDRLRSLINQKLGHANFNAYINSIRIDAVRHDFADPAVQAEPILTLAMDAGFKSISAFNRAFKSATGQTPSEYRARITEKAGLPGNQ